MKFIVNTDENNYITGLDLSPNGVTVPDEVYYSNQQGCYKYIDGVFTLDEDKVKALEDAAKAQAEELAMKPTVEDLAEAINVLTNIVTGGNE